MKTFIEQWFSSGLVISLASNGNLAGDLHISTGYAIAASNPQQ